MWSTSTLEHISFYLPSLLFFFFIHFSGLKFSLWVPFPCPPQLAHTNSSLCPLLCISYHILPHALPQGISVFSLAFVTMPAYLAGGEAGQGVVQLQGFGCSGPVSSFYTYHKELIENIFLPQTAIVRVGNL